MRKTKKIIGIFIFAMIIIGFYSSAYLQLSEVFDASSESLV